MEDTPTHVAYKIEFINNLIAYLQTKPYGEVAEAIENLRKGTGVTLTAKEEEDESIHS